MSLIALSNASEAFCKMDSRYGKSAPYIPAWSSMRFWHAFNVLRIRAAAIFSDTIIVIFSPTSIVLLPSLRLSHHSPNQIGVLPQVSRFAQNEEGYRCNPLKAKVKPYHLHVLTVWLTLYPRCINYSTLSTLQSSYVFLS